MFISNKNMRQINTIYKSTHNQLVLTRNKSCQVQMEISKEIEPLAHHKTGNLTPPFTKWPVMVYNGIPGGSRMHDTCRFCSGHTAVSMSSLNSGTPRASAGLKINSSAWWPAGPVSLISQSLSLLVSPPILQS